MSELNFFKKLNPFQGLEGSGGGLASIFFAGPSAFAEGGTEIEEGGYKYHVFTTPGTLTTKVDNLGVEYLVVGGGGAGAQYIGGGGGGGGVRFSAISLGPASTINITVGAGGTQAITGVAEGGWPSSLGSFITSDGGGTGGGSKTPNASLHGGNGGSGGGGGNYQTVGSYGSGNVAPYHPSQGNPGGIAQYLVGGGGGGGAGEAGGVFVIQPAPFGAGVRSGGNGVPVPVSWIPDSYGTPGPQPGRWFGGGGSGGGQGGDGSSTPVHANADIPGGAGGGGYGNNYTIGDKSPIGGPPNGLMYTRATVNGENTGGGGGGAGGNGDDFSADAGLGAKGIVAVRYPIAGDLTVYGEAEYTTAGIYSWVAPADAAASGICVVCVGGGGGGNLYQNDYNTGGGGGALAYRNNMPVVAGNTYVLEVGAGGVSNGPSGGTNGGASYFVNSGPTGVYANGGGGANSNGGSGGAGGSGDAAYSGGVGGQVSPTAPVGMVVGGGGGAAGYSGNGGAGGVNYDTNGINPSGAGSGGGGGGGISLGGGGVGIYGRGSSGGTVSGNSAHGLGGSGGSSTGTPGNAGAGGTYGGGGGYNEFGASGAVRIIWGTGRAFPDTLTGKLRSPAPA